MFPEFTNNLQFNYYLGDYRQEYKVKLNFHEINDIRLFPNWIEQVFFENLGFYTKEFMFLEKHQLIGKMRFLQVREDPINECDFCDKYYNDTTKDLSLCFREEFTQSTDPLMKFNCTVLKDQFNASNELLLMLKIKKNISVYVKDSMYCNDTEEYDKNIFKNPCLRNLKGEITESSNPFICEMQEFGFKYRSLSQNITDINKSNSSNSSKIVNQSFIYDGQINKYSTDHAYYFDLDFIKFSKMYNFSLDNNNNVNNSTQNLYKQKLKEFSEDLFLSWLDYNSRLLVISFNIYKTNLSDSEEVISVSFFLEFSKTQLILKRFEILFYRNNNTFTFKDILYFFILFMYSITYLYFNIIEIIKERMNIIYKDFVWFLINFSLNCLIFLVVILKFLFVLYSMSAIEPYSKNEFQEYFPINYYVQSEYYISLLELLMIALIIVNILNSFYFEFFARIFLTFKYMWRNLVAYMTIYFIIIFAFSQGCYVLYGDIIAGN